jgi:hypothetical protein
MLELVPELDVASGNDRNASRKQKMQHWSTALRYTWLQATFEVSEELSFIFASDDTLILVENVTNLSLTTRSDDKTPSVTVTGSDWFECHS